MVDEDLGALCDCAGVRTDGIWPEPLRRAGREPELPLTASSRGGERTGGRIVRLAVMARMLALGVLALTFDTTGWASDPTVRAAERARSLDWLEVRRHAGPAAALRCRAGVSSTQV